MTLAYSDTSNLGIFLLIGSHVTSHNTGLGLSVSPTPGPLGPQDIAQGKNLCPVQPNLWSFYQL